MKVLILLALIVLSAGLCAAQTQPDENAAPGVVIVQKGWRRFLVRNPALDQDPLRALENQDRSERIREEVARQSRVNVAHGREPLTLPSRNATNPLPPRKPPYPYVYSYRVKISNTGAKRIRGVIWEYVLIDETTGSEVGRHRFESKVSVRPGKTKTLYGRSTLPPASRINAMQAGEAPEGQNSEHVVMKRIYYDDNSVWERATE